MHCKLWFLVGLIMLGMVTSMAQAKEYHVSVNGNDANKGSYANPLRTIQAAAMLAQPGDVITVHEGIYREEINPPRGGTSDKKRIIFQAAKGENVEIRGSEVVENWSEETDGVWKVEVPNSLFGDFNPFADEVSGDWFNPFGRKHHTGCVYIDGEWLFEAASKDQLLEQKSWYAKVDDQTTTIWATFDGANPNQKVTEINVRQTVFYPRKPFTNYITVRGFKMRQAAPKWAPPTAEQMGLIGTHWSKGWIIEGNKISHSINVGISLGKYGDEFDNTGATAGAYLDSIDRARNEMNWNKETIGSHIVRNNEISWCEQAGIVGSMGAAFSEVTGNHIHHIYTQRRFGGAEMAGIKFHAPIDMLIRGNRIHDAFQGIWLDWMTQGTRVSSNLCYRNTGNDLFLEVNHGPFVINNNIFLSKLVRNHSQGGAYVHNLFGGVVGVCPESRHTPYFKAHSTEKVADNGFDEGDDRFYNNMFDGSNGPDIDSGWWEGMKTNPTWSFGLLGAPMDIMKTNPTWSFGYGLWVYDKRPQGPRTGGNIYYDRAKPYECEDAVVVKSKPDIKLEENKDGVYLYIMFDPQQSKVKTQLITSELLGRAQVPNLPFESPEGNSFVIDTDYLGKKRNLKHPYSGPFESPGIGRVKLKVWPLE